MMLRPPRLQDAFERPDSGAAAATGRGGFALATAWVVGLALVWPVIGDLAAAAGSAALAWIPDVGILELPMIAGYLFEGLVAYLFLVSLCRWLRAPRRVWLGIAAAEAFRVVLFLAALVAMTLGLHLSWLQPFLFSRIGQGPLSAAEQLSEFVGGWVWGAVFSILGAWMGSR
jgi:hypothetical protein